MSRIYIRDNRYPEAIICAVDKDDFEKVKLADCYREDGQRIGHESAGDISVWNRYNRESIYDTFLEEFNEEHEGTVDSVEDAYAIDPDWVNDWDHENGEFQTALAHTIQNGNWKSIIIQVDMSEEFITNEVVDDETAKEFDKMLKNMTKVKSSCNYDQYEYEEFIIHEDAFQWYQYRIVDTSKDRAYKHAISSIDLDFI